MFETLECTNSFEVASNDSLQQCLTYSGGKMLFFLRGGGGGSNLGLKGSKSVPKLGFLPFSQDWLISFL